MLLAALASTLLSCSPAGLSDDVFLASPVPQTAPANAAPSPEDVLAHPDSVEPMLYIEVVDALWARGDRAQAAFWYYLWQIRTRPWARRGPPHYAQLRGALMEVRGRPINEWIGSDVDARTDLATRAMAYERTMPLSAERPEGLTAEQWQAAVAAERDSYAAEFREVMAYPQFQPEAQRAARRRNGLPVGPWVSPGAPLPDDWR